MFKEWEKLKNGERLPHKSLNPDYRGNTICLFYQNNEPLITIGPNYKFSLLEIFLTNILMYFALVARSKIQFLWHVSIIVVVLKNVSFLLVVLVNPGLLPRDPNLHNRGRLRHISEFDQSGELCDQCDIIKPNPVEVNLNSKCKNPIRKLINSLKIQTTPKGTNIRHCHICDVCVDGYDHHCMWSGKCIGRGNIKFFFIYLGMLLVCGITFWINLIVNSVLEK